VGTTTARPALILLVKGTAEAIDAVTVGQHYIASWIERPARAGENKVKTPRYDIAIPLVIRLLTYARVPRLRIALTRRNIFRRDNFACQYCGASLPPAHLTIDHVVARSRGGTTTWENVVTACGKCNRRKGSRRAEETGLKLASRPSVPNWDPVLASSPEPIRPEWKRFLISQK
jgi:5-methylcytosine-specific restriction endonuclease McrA